MTEASDTLRNKRVVVLTSRLWAGYNDLWDGVEPEIGALAVVGARPSMGDSRADDSLHRTALRSIDVGRGLVWEHVVGFRRFVRRFQADLVHVNRELWAVASQEILSCGTRVVVHGAENLWQHGGRAEQMIRNRLVERAVRHIHGYASWNHDGAEHVSALRQKIGLAPIPTMVLGHCPSWTVPPCSLESSEDGPLRVLLVGRATYEKGFQDVIDAAADLGDVRITLCGARGTRRAQGPSNGIWRGVRCHRVGEPRPGRRGDGQVPRAGATVADDPRMDRAVRPFSRRSDDRGPALRCVQLRWTARISSSTTPALSSRKVTRKTWVAVLSSNRAGRA